MNKKAKILALIALILITSIAIIAEGSFILKVIEIIGTGIIGACIGYAYARWGRKHQNNK